MMRRVVAALAAALVASLVLAGCATIPRTGPVERGGDTQDDPFGQIDFLPNAPVNGESQAQVLNGFIAAAVSPDGGYQIAREFLSSSYSNRWDPDASVTVDDESSRSQPVRDTGSTMSLDVNPVAFVDGEGDYLAAASAAPIRLHYSFVKQHGQWRISKAPDGVVIDQSKFPTVFNPHTLYFYSSDYKFLVPDQRWFPATSTSLSTRIVAALLAGPSKWLQGAVATAFPNGTQLGSGSVPVQSGTAQVDLTSPASSADALAVSRMEEQLSASLSSPASVTDVALSIGGVTRASPGSAGTGAVSDPPVSANPLVLKGGKFGFLSGGDVTALPAIGGKIASLQPTAVTVSADATIAVAQAAGGVYAISAAASAPVEVDDRSGLVAPALDPRGDVWSAPASQPGAFQVAPPDGGKPVALTAAWPDARTLDAFAISRDGTRLAALVTTADGGIHLMVAGINRAANGTPSKIGEPIDLGSTGLASGLSLAWTDELTLVALGAAHHGGTELVEQPVGGTATTETGPTGGRAVAGGNPSDQDYWVLDSGHTLQESRGNGWQAAATGVEVLGTQLGRS